MVDHVFVTSCSDSVLPGPFRSPQLPVPRPLVDAVYSTAPVTRQQHEAHHRRMLAAALSKARVQATLSSAHSGVAPLRLSRVLVGLTVGDVPRDGETADVGVFSNSATVPLPSAEGSDDEAVPDTAPMELSHTAVTDFKTCPKRYYFRKIAKLPVFPSSAMLYGSGMSADRQPPLPPHHNPPVRSLTSRRGGMRHVLEGVLGARIRS